jgi:hypothetical protein
MRVCGRPAAALSRAAAAIGPYRRRVVGTFRDSEFMRRVDEECMRVRAAEREAARRGELAE